MKPAGIVNLEKMLDSPEEAIVGTKMLHPFRHHDSGFFEIHQTGHCVTGEQLRVQRVVQHQERLQQKFDIADTAGTIFDVRSLTAVLNNGTAAQGTYRLDDAVSSGSPEAPRENRLHLPEKFPSEFKITGNRRELYQGLQLP